MKKKFLFVVTLLAVSLLVLAEMNVYIYKKDGTKVEYLAADLDSIGFVDVRDDNVDGQTGIANGHEWVDLGLPSGTKWATTNVGATTPEDYGNYYAWGETTTKSTYNWSTYKWCKGSYSTMTKYCTSSFYGTVDNKTTLELSDDAAYVNWGSSWHMPTSDEIGELINTSYTTWTWTTQNGVQGYKVTSKTNGNRIFLPAAGYRYGSDLLPAGYGYYWSSSLYTSNSSDADDLDFNLANVSRRSNFRYYGQTVRPVLRKTYTITFDANGGSGTMEKLNVKQGDSVTLPTNNFTKGSSNFTIWNTEKDGSGVTFYADKSSIIPTSSMTLYAQWDMTTAGVSNGHEWVDLGLPSGTKWATYNVGAYLPEEYGDYFAWGETTTKSTYDWTTYKWCEGSENSLNKYTTEINNAMVVDNKELLEVSDDAANVNWGGLWRMPTESEIRELTNSSYTAWIWTSLNGVNGYKVKSKMNGNSIFLPAAGYRCGSDLGSAGSYGNYWSCSLYRSSSNGAYILYFGSGKVLRNYYNRDCGHTVRPVLRE